MSASLRGTALLGRQESLDRCGRGASAAVHHALDVDPDVRMLKVIDPLPAQMAMRKERERVACDLFEDGVVVATRQRHMRTTRDAKVMYEGDD